MAPTSLLNSLANEPPIEDNGMVAFSFLEEQ